MSKIKVIVLRTAGTNCDKETAFSFDTVGADAELVHVNELLRKEKILKDYQIMAVPGGFSYGDDLAAGKILANELKYKLLDGLKQFISDGKLIIGICNGFQILVKAGLLPGLDDFNQETTLMLNDSGKFEDRWVYLRSSMPDTRSSRCIWTQNLPEVIYLPIAHGEGKFVTKDKAVVNKLKENKQIVFKYCDENGKAGDYPVNPNGSTEDIAGICDETGRIFGLMPHPERHFIFEQHPHWTRIKTRTKFGDGEKIFRNGVEYAKKNL